MTTAVSQRPFVHLFRTDGALYAYDVNSSIVAEVDALNWTLLGNWDQADDVIARRAGSGYDAEAVARARNRIRGLGEEGELFSSRRPLGVCSPHTKESAERKLASECRQIILCVSEACNLRCKYCYYTGGRDNERSHGSALMTWETAEKAVRFFMSHCKGTLAKYKEQAAEIAQGKTVQIEDVAARPCVGFYGGEPLTNWPLMKRVIEYVRAADEGDQYLINCTINGTLLTARIADFMAANNVSLSVSLDGPRHIHDRYRRTVAGDPTWDTVVANLMYIRETAPAYYDDHVGLLGVMAPPLDLRELAAYVEETAWLPKRSIRFNGLEEDSPPCFWGPLSPGDKEITSEGLWDEYLQALVSGELNYEGGRAPADRRRRRRIGFLRGLYNLNIMHAYSRTRSMYEGKSLLPLVVANNFGMCLPGQERIYIRIDGKILPCERLPSEAPDFIIGDIDTGFDFDKVMHITEGNAALLEEKCVNCWNIRMCSIQCHKIVGPEGMLSGAAKAAACEDSKARSHHSLAAMCAILERNPKALEFMNRI